MRYQMIPWQWKGYNHAKAFNNIATFLEVIAYAGRQR